LEAGEKMKKSKVKVNTVNVIEYYENPLLVRSFKDTIEGNVEAERLFVDLITEHNKEGGVNPNKQQLKDMLDEGCYSDGMGYEIYIVHSN
jgi:hypothetical protein